jgi:hypothetical protein
MKKEQPPIGEYWKESKFSTLYQLYRRVEFIANELRRRQRDGHAPLVAHVKELDAIANELKIWTSRRPNLGANSFWVSQRIYCQNKFLFINGLQSQTGMIELSHNFGRMT